MSQDSPCRELIAVPDAAHYLGVAPRTIRRWIASGDLTGYRVGPKVIRLDRVEVEALARPIPTLRTGA